MISTKRWGIHALAGALAIVGCAGVMGTLRPVTPVGEVPSGEYDVRVLSALAPTKQPDGEVIAAVLYTRPSGPRVEVWETSYPTGSRGWLWEQLGEREGASPVGEVSGPLSGGDPSGSRWAADRLRASPSDRRPRFPPGLEWKDGPLPFCRRVYRPRLHPIR